MNMEEVGDLKPTKKSRPVKRALPEDVGDDDEAEKLEKGKESSSPPRKRTNASEISDAGEIIEGKRQKKAVQRLQSSVAKPKERVKIEQGRGDKLGDIIRVAHFIGKMKAVDLKPLHKVIFDRPGAASSVKKNIRQFSGFPFEADSQPYLKKKEMMKKFTNALLKNMCYVLDLERSGTHDAKIERIIAFLLDPKISGKTLPKKKKRKTKDSKRKAQKRKAQRSNRKNVQEDSKSRAIVTDSSTDDDDNNEQDGQGEADVTEKSTPEPKSRETISDDEDDSSDVVDKDTDEEVKQPKVMKKKPPPKKKPARAKPARTKPAPKTKKADSSSGRRKKADNTSAGSDLDDSSDDEPLAKMVRKPLTDEQLKETMEKLLKGANLEEVTMKQICKQVFDTYPEHDLSSRKDYIKQTVKQLIS